MSWQFLAFCECGDFRSENQDAYLADPDRNIFAVADGMGGLEGGAEASRMTIEHLDQFLSKYAESEMRELILKINQACTQYGNSHYIGGFGSTLTLVRIKNNRAYLGHMGDSSAYLFRKGRLLTLTREHTVAEEMATEQNKEAHEIPYHMYHSLTRCIGQDPKKPPDTETLTLKTNDRLFLCTDGINKIISESALQTLFTEYSEPEPLMEAIKQCVYENGAPDNLTGVLVY